MMPTRGSSQSADHHDQAPTLLPALMMMEVTLIIVVLRVTPWRGSTYTKCVDYVPAADRPHSIFTAMPPQTPCASSADQTHRRI